MDAIMAGFFDEVFNKYERGYLVVHHRRQMLARYWSTVAAACGGASAAKVAVQAALDRHTSVVASNHKVCPLGKEHNLLYVAAQVAFEWRVDVRTTAALLSAMFSCEGTFERLALPAALGPKAAQLLSGWYSDFGAQALPALLFFAAAADATEALYDGHRLVEVGVGCCGGTTAAQLAAGAGREDALRSLLDLGARLKIDAAVASRLRSPISFTSPLRTLVLRAVAYLPFDEDLNDFFPEFGSPPSLRHISCVAAREALADAFYIPYKLSDFPKFVRQALLLIID